MHIISSIMCCHCYTFCIRSLFYASVMARPKTMEAGTSGLSIFEPRRPVHPALFYPVSSILTPACQVACRILLMFFFVQSKPWPGPLVIPACGLTAFAWGHQKPSPGLSVSTAAPRGRQVGGVEARYGGDDQGEAPVRHPPVPRCAAVEKICAFINCIH